MIRSHLEEPPPDPRIHVSMPETAAEAVLKALAKKPENRFSSVGEFVQELSKPDHSEKGLAGKTVDKSLLTHE
jgi:serine/threonine protein kinase